MSIDTAAVPRFRHSLKARIIQGIVAAPPRFRRCRWERIHGIFTALPLNE